MPRTRSPRPAIAADEKLTATMFYTGHSMIWGQVFSKKPIRVSTWLLTDMAPNYLTIFDAQVLIIGGSKPASLKFPDPVTAIANDLAKLCLFKPELLTDCFELLFGEFEVVTF
jgi:hypothetical protein